MLAGAETLLYLRIVIQSKKSRTPKKGNCVPRCDNVARFVI